MKLQKIISTLLILLVSELQAQEKIEYYTLKEKAEMGMVLAPLAAGASVALSAGAAAVSAMVGGIFGGPAGAIIGAKVGGTLGGGAGVIITGVIANSDIKKTTPEIPKKIIFEKIIDQPSSEQWEAYKQFRDGNEPLVIVRHPFSFPKEAQINQNLIEAQLLSLRQGIGRPIFGGQFVVLANQAYAQDLANAIADPNNGQSGTNIQSIKNRLSQHPTLFTYLRRQALLSFAAPQDEKFADLLKEIIAQAAELNGKAYHHPVYERLLTAEERERNERTAKEAAQAEFRAERRDFNAERGIRNQLQADLNAERADKAQIQQRALAARQDATIQKFQLYQYAAQLEADLQAANAEGEIRYQLQRDLDEERDHRALIQMQRDDLQSDYNMASADRVKVEAQLAQVRNAQKDSTAQKFQLYQHAAQLEAALEAAHEQIAAKDQNAIEVALGLGELEEENDALRQQLQLMQKQLADLKKIIRKQSNTNKRAVNKLQALKRAQQRNAQA